MNKILITGGVGFIGFNLVKNLCKENQLTIIDDLSRGKIDNEFKSFIIKNKINLLKINLCKKINIKNNFDYIFHLAATVGVQNVTKNPIYTVQNNIQSLLNLITFCRSKKNTKLIFFSTSEVYSPLIDKNLRNIFQSLCSNGFFITAIPNKESMFQLLNSMYEADIFFYNGAFQRFNPTIEIDNILPIMKNLDFDSPSLHTDTITIDYKFFDKLLKDVKTMNLSYSYFDKKERCSQG